MRLSLLSPGKAFTVRKVTSGREVGKRLADMGFTEGASGKIVRKGLFGGPIQAEIRGYGILIRKSEAAMIEVDERSEAGPHE